MGSRGFANRIRENLISIREDGSFRLDMSYFNYLGGVTMTNEKFSQLFDGLSSMFPEGKILVF